MNKMLRNIIIMAVILAVAVLALIFIPKLEPKQEVVEPVDLEPTQDPAELLISDKAIEDVVKVTLSYDGKETVLLYDKANEKYYLDGYEEFDFDQTKIRNIFYTASHVEVEEEISDDMSNIDEFGLKEPTATLTAEFEDGSTDVYYFGDKVPGLGEYYMLKEGIDKVFIVWINYGNNAKMVLEDLIQVAAIELTVDDLEIVRIHKNGELYMEFENIKGDNIIEQSLWLLKEPYERSVSTAEEDSFYSMVDDILSVKPTKVLDSTGDPKEYGLDNPWISVDLVKASGEEITMLFGDEIDGFYAMKYADDDIIYQVAERLMTFEKYKPIDVIERLLMLVDIRHVSKIKLSGVLSDNFLIVTKEEKLDKDGNVELDQNGEAKVYTNYIVDGVDLTEDEREQGSWFYQSILSVSIMNEAEEDFVPGPPVGKVELELNKEPFTFTIEFYEYNDYFYAVKYNDNERFLVVKKEDVMKIPENFELLRERKLERPY